MTPGNPNSVAAAHAPTKIEEVRTHIQNYIPNIKSVL